MKVQQNQPQPAVSDTNQAKGGEETAQKTGKAFENVLENKTQFGTQNNLAAQTGQKGAGAMIPQPKLSKGPDPNSLQGKKVNPQQTTEVSEKSSTSVSGKMFKGVLDKQQNQSEIGGGTPGSQGMPLAAYLEPGAPKAVEDVQHAGMNVQDIEKLVDRVLVGVNEVGDPQFKMDMHMDKLGPLNIEITRTAEGLQIKLNAETEKTGLQLGQNLATLQETLTQKGLQVQNIQLLVGNEPIAVNQLIDSPKTGFQERIHRKDRVQKTATEKPSKPAPRGR